MLKKQSPNNILKKDLSEQMSQNKLAKLKSN